MLICSSDDGTFNQIAAKAKPVCETRSFPSPIFNREKHFKPEKDVVPSPLSLSLHAGTREELEIVGQRESDMDGRLICVSERRTQDGAEVRGRPAPPWLHPAAVSPHGRQSAGRRSSVQSVHPVCSSGQLLRCVMVGGVAVREDRIGGCNDTFALARVIAAAVTQGQDERGRRRRIRLI